MVNLPLLTRCLAHCEASEFKIACYFSPAQKAKLRAEPFFSFIVSYIVMGFLRFWLIEILKSKGHTDPSSSIGSI